MISLAGIQVSVLEVTLLIALVALTCATILNAVRVSQLQKKLETYQLSTSREIKMVNQGSIGLGRRFASFEKEIKAGVRVASAPEQTAKGKKAVASFERIRNQVMSPEKTGSSGGKAEAYSDERKFKTRAEQTLSSWLTEQQSA